VETHQHSTSMLFSVNRTSPRFESEMEYFNVSIRSMDFSSVGQLLSVLLIALLYKNPAGFLTYLSILRTESRLWNAMLSVTVPFNFWHSLSIFTKVCITLQSLKLTVTAHSLILYVDANKDLDAKTCGVRAILLSSHHVIMNWHSSNRCSSNSQVL
jgi:hypothetical protein